VNWQGVLKQKGVKQTDVKEMDIKQGLCVLPLGKGRVFPVYALEAYQGDLASLTNLTFRGPCIVRCSYNKTNEMH